MTTDNRTNEPTPEQIEAAAQAVREVDARAVLIADVDLPMYRARAALVAAQGAAPQAGSGEPWLDAAGNEAQRCLRCGKYVFECCESFAPVQPSSTVDEGARRLSAWPTVDEVRERFEKSADRIAFGRLIAEVERAAANAVLVELLPVLEDAESNAYTVQNDRAIGNEMDEELARVEAAAERARAAALGLTTEQEGEAE